MNGCKNNCCQNWRIDIDKTTYEKYIGLEDELKNEITKHIGNFPDGSPRKYIKLTPNGYCPFLDDKGLCTLQLRFGYDFLCVVCKIYPRIACEVSGSPEYFVELSCEAAVNHVLFEKKFMSFDEVEIDFETYKATALNFTYALDTKKYTQNSDGHNIFWKLRVASVLTLQSRNYPIRFRMLLLCMFIQEIANLITNNMDSKIITHTDSYMERLENGFYNELFKSVPDGAGREFDIVLDVLREVHRKHTMFKPIMDDIVNGFGIEPGSWKIPENFDERYNNYYSMYLAKNEYVVENYLVYRVLFEGFPFNYKAKSGIMNNYVELYAKLNLIEFLITGICRQHNKFDKRFICEAISLFSRGYEHSPTKFFLEESDK